MKKTKKLLSLVLAVIMVLGCCGMSTLAIEWPKDLEAGEAQFRTLATVKSVEISVGKDFTKITDDAEFIVYYTEEDLGDNYDALTLVLKAEEVAKVHKESAYLAENVLHIDLSSLKLSKEGYYYIYIAGGSLAGEECQNLIATTKGVEYKYESLSIVGKLQAVINYLLSMISNLLSYQKTF